MISTLAALLLAATLTPTLARADVIAPKEPGAQLWVTRYDGLGYGGSSPYALKLSPDGSKVYVTGETPETTGFPDYLTVAYDAVSGKQLWVDRYNGPGNGVDDALAMGVSPDGGAVFVTGWSSGLSSVDYATVAYDASSGRQLWVRRYDGTGHLGDEAYALAVSPDSSQVFVTGTSWAANGNYDYATIAYDATTGHQLWVRRYDDPTHGSDGGDSLAVSPDGSTVFASGYSWADADGYDVVTFAYDTASGRVGWSARYNGPGNQDDAPITMAVAPDGSKVFIGGYQTGVTTVTDYLTVAYQAPTGHQAWAQSYNGGGGGTDLIHGLVVSGDSSKVFVTGSSEPPAGWSDYATIGYDASSGSQLWVSRYDSGPQTYDVASAVGVSPDGSSVYVTGNSPGAAGDIDYVTLAYDGSSGAELWLSRYDGPAHGIDTASALGVSVNGSTIFVTGSSGGPPGTSDYATVAYSST